MSDYPDDILISIEELQFLLEEEYGEHIDIAENNCFCRSCFNKKEYSMVNYKAYLTHSNSLYFKGFCSTCQEPIGRYIEIGEQEYYYKRGQILRNRKAN